MRRGWSSADHTAWGKGKGNNNFLALPKNLTQIRHTGVTDGEKLRVLYVALTRAKSTLYITNSLHDFNGKSPERLEYLEEYVEKNDVGVDEVVSPFLPRGKVVQVSIEETMSQRVKNVQNWLANYIAESPEMRGFYKAQMANLKMSASMLTSFLDIIYSGPQEFFKNYILGAPREPDGWALVLGNLMHETFEQVAKTGLNDEEALEYFEKQVEKYDTTEENRRIAYERGMDSLGPALIEFGDIIRKGEAEVDFYSEKVVVNGVPITGKIDLIVKDDKSKTLEIYDYKTGAYHDGKWQANPSSYWHMLQLMFYKLLLNNSAKYRNYRVVRGHILYVMRDAKTDEVYDKVLEFDEVDNEEFLKLLTAVYEQTTSLAFLDDAELFLEADKNRSMRQVQDFIKLLLAKSE